MNQIKSKMLSRTIRNVTIRNYSIAIASTDVVKETSKPDGWDNAKPFESMPGPKPAPIIGNKWRYFIGPLSKQDFIEVNKVLHKTYGDISKLTHVAPIKDMILVCNPKDIEMMYRNEGLYPVRHGFQSIADYRNIIRKDVFGDHGSLLSAHGEPWRDVRSKVNPILMQPRTAQQYIPSMDIIASEFLERIKELATLNQEGEMPADFQNELNKWAFESIGMIALDKRLGCLDKHPNEEAQTMIYYMVDSFRLMYVLDFTPYGYYSKKYNLEPWKKFIKYQDFFTNMALKYIDEATERIKNDPNYANKPQSEKSAFERFIEKDKMVATVMTLDMLSGGIDTTGKVTGATLYFLAKNQNAQDKLRAELKSLLPNKNDPITKDILENAPYLKAAIKEATRFAPIAVGNTRLLTKDIVLGGYQVPKGINVIVPNLYISMQPHQYKEPTKYIPDRWLKTTEGDLSYKNSNPFATLPFGFGARSCIGKRLANLEMEIVIAKIIRNLKLSWPHDDMIFGQDMMLYGIRSPLKIRVKPLDE